MTGAGPVGLMAVAVARRMGAKRIVVTDVSDYRLELARGLGADLVVNPRARSLEAARRDLGIGEGFGVAWEMSGEATALDELIRNMAHGGRVVALGLPGGAGIHVDWSAVVFKMLTIQGVCGRQNLRHLARDGGPRRRRSGPVADHHPPLFLRGSRSGFRNRRLGPVRESHSRLVGATPRESDRWKTTSCEQRVLTTEWRS